MKLEIYINKLLFYYYLILYIVYVKNVQK